MTKRILVVEDQEDNRRILRDLLVHGGFEALNVNLTALFAQGILREVEERCDAVPRHRLERVDEEVRAAQGGRRERGGIDEDRKSVV